MLIADVRRRAVLAKIQASEDLQRERIQQVRYGSALDADLIESRADVLQANQELLTTELQRSDLQMQLNDAIALPLATPLLLDPAVSTPSDQCEREACIRAALDSHPEIAEARAQVEKAASTTYKPPTKWMRLSSEDLDSVQFGRDVVNLQMLRVRNEGAVVFADIAAPPINLLGTELVHDLVALIQHAEADATVQVLVSEVQTLTISFRTSMSRGSTNIGKTPRS